MGALRTWVVSLDTTRGCCADGLHQPSRLLHPDVFYCCYGTTWCCYGLLLHGNGGAAGLKLAYHGRNQHTVTALRVAVMPWVDIRLSAHRNCSAGSCCAVG